MNRRQSHDWLINLVATHFAIRERKPSMQWVLENITIPASVSPTHPGAFNADLFPLANIVYDWFDDPLWRELVVVKSSQAGISQAFQNLTCYIADNQLGDILWLFESATKAKQINRERIKPMLVECKALGHLIPESDDDLQNFILMLKGLKIILAGAQSASQAASRTIRHIFCDEGDEYPLELQGGESHAWTLIRERAKLIENAKLALFSKPRADLKDDEGDIRLRNRKKKDDGIVWKEFMAGTRHKCLIPCRNEHCSEPFEIVWELIKFAHCRTKSGGWDFDKMLEETLVECPHCKGTMTDDEKVGQILKHRIWRPTNPGTDADPAMPGRMSVHISDLYTNSREFPTLSLGALSIKCVSAKNESDRKAFRRGNLALPTQSKKVEKATLAKIMAMAGTFPKGTLPCLPTAVLFLIDVQAHGRVFKWAKVAFDDVDFDNPALDPCWVLDYGQTDMHAELLAAFEAPVYVAEDLGRTMDRTTRAQIGWIDEGDGVSTQIVLNMLLQPGFRHRLSSAKGRSGVQVQHMKDRVEPQDNKIHNGQHVKRYNFDTEYFMDELHEVRIGKRQEIMDAMLKGETPPAGLLTLCADPDPAFCEEFCNEAKGWHLRQGKMVWGWPLKPEGGKNDFSDIVRMGIAFWYRIKQKFVRDRLKAAKEAAEAAAMEAQKASKP